MSSLDDRIKRHFTEKLNDVQVIDVPEWADENGNPTKIYVRPMSIEEKGYIQNSLKSGSIGDACVATLIIRARDESGARLFTKADRLMLTKHADADVIERIVREMTDISDAGTDVEELEKN